ncbi:flagellin [uncultured Jannaschia sp.]|uniref:flagellin N-terminal helical domain-containing protein n=1 Tax=uncultured Jannaschia sp. TaxID=293347 RepID=UPI0026102839|nr:flagellin [uncultured Jannaschia sp.]
MTSILTNNGAMVALQTLKSINSNLETTQNEISTGKKVGSAKDNSAIWAISKVMESDVSGFKAVKDSLSLGESTVSVASAGAEQIVDVLNEMKELAISAHSENVDHGKIEATLAKKREQIQAIIGSSQFNGTNLLKTDTDGNGSTGLTVVSSLDRTGAGAPATSTITVASADFETNVDTTGATAITDKASAATALTEIEGWLTKAVEGASSLGAAAARISDQSEFIGRLSDTMEMGIGSLVDADMEESSARLKALQTQQQLGVQSLSIANQAPGAIMSLFR